MTRVHKRGWINSCHVVKNRGGKENGAAPSDESHPRSRGDTRVELSPETTWSRPPRRRGRHGRGAPATCAPRGPAPSAGFGSSAPAGRDGRSRGQTSWFAEPRRSAAEGGEGASDSRKPRAGGGGRRHRAFPRFHPLGRRVRGSESSPGRSRRPSHRVALRRRERWPDASAL